MSLFKDPTSRLMRYVVRGTVLGFLEKWDVKDLQYCIGNQVTLATLLKLQPEHLVSFRKLARKVPSWAASFDPDYCISWLRENRGDLADILDDELGRAWLRLTVEQLRETLWFSDDTTVSARELEEIKKLLDLDETKSILLAKNIKVPDADNIQ